MQGHLPLPTTEDVIFGYNHLHLVCMIASVIKDHRRLRYFRMLLDSIRAQIILPKQVLVSIYIEPKLLDNNADFDALFEGLPMVHVARQDKPKRQFVQIRELLNQHLVEGERDTFVMFSDDDDLWHPKRCFYYYTQFAMLYKHAINIIPTIAYMVALEQTSHVNGYCKLCAEKNETNVDAMLACGCCKFVFQAEHSLVEFHEYVVRPVVMRDFFSRFSDLVETNRFADMQFRREVAGWGGKDWNHAAVVPPHWLYYYRQCDPSYAAATQPGATAETQEEHTKEYVSYFLDMLFCPNMVEDPRMIDPIKKQLQKEDFKKEWLAQGKRLQGLCLCDYCGQWKRDGAFPRCSGCRTTYYCSVECHKAHWKKNHRLECKKK